VWGEGGVPVCLYERMHGSLVMDCDELPRLVEGYTRVEDQAAMTHASDHVSWANPKFVSIAGGGQLEYSGALFKKGTGHSLFGRRNWKLRHFELNMHHAELLYFAPNSKDNGAHGKASPPPLWHDSTRLM